MSATTPAGRARRGSRHHPPTEAFFGYPDVGCVRLSPNGRLVAYVAKSHGSMNVWCTSLASGAVHRPLTRFRRSVVSNFSWLGDDRIGFALDAEGRETYDLFTVSLLDGCIERVMRGRSRPSVFIAAEAADETRAFIATSNATTSAIDVYDVDLNGRCASLNTPNPGSVMKWLLDERRLVAGAQKIAPNGTIEILYRASPQDPWKRVLSWDGSEALGEFIAVNSAAKVAYVLTAAFSDRVQLLAADIQSGSVSVVAEHPTYDISECVFDMRSMTPHFVRVSGMRTEWIALSAAARRLLAQLVARFGSDFRLVSTDRSMTRWVVLVDLGDRPNRYHVYDAGADSATPTFSSLRQLDRYAFGTPEPVVIEARDRLLLPCYLTRPAAGREDPAPAIVRVHGGPWERDHWGFDTEVQFLASRGYAVLQVNFRGSAGFGRDFMNAGNREWGRAMQDDLIDAKSWLVARGIAREGEVGILGGSYGGYAVLAALAFTPADFACGIAISAPSNLVSLLASLPAYWGPLRGILKRRIADPETERDFLMARSPITSVERVCRPVFLAHGENDPRVPAEDVSDFARRINPSVPVDVVMYPGEGHEFRSETNRCDLYDRIASFLARHLPISNDDGVNGGRTR